MKKRELVLKYLRSLVEDGTLSLEDFDEIKWGIDGVELSDDKDDDEY